MSPRTLFILAVGAAALAATGCKSDKKPINPDPNRVATEARATKPAVGSFGDAEIATAIERELVADGLPVGGAAVSVELGIASLRGHVPHLLAKNRAAKIARSIRGVRAVVDRLVVLSPERDDSAIARDIKSALLMDPAAESFEVDVAVTDGVARLTGAVDSWQELRLAGVLASEVKGVKRVDNDVRIELETERTDLEILADVESRLRWDVMVDSDLIDVLVVDGEVRLDGMVGTLAERERAAADAWVLGARSVDASGLAVDWFAADRHRRDRRFVLAPDAEIKAAITDAILLDPRVKSFRVDVAVERGTVTLTGSTANQLARRAAERIAELTTGVRAVVNQIVVESAKSTEDLDLERRIVAALVANPITEAFEIDVSVDDGVVTLAGAVDGTIERSTANALAMRFDGAVVIRNELQVLRLTSAATAEPDPEIKAQVVEQLTWDPVVDAYDIDVEVSGGVVTLRGQVDSQFERRQAVTNAYQGGAIAVDDELEIRRE